MADHRRRADTDPELHEAIRAGRKAKRMPSVPSDALVVFRCLHDDNRAPLVGFIARGGGGLLLVCRDRIGPGAPGWSSVNLTPAMLQNFRDYGRAAHCGDHALRLEGEDWIVPRPGYPRREVKKGPGPAIT